MSLHNAINEMHERCAIFTSREVANRILDWLGWTSSSDLRECTLLEPCVGDGAILVEAARRLIVSFQRLGVSLDAKQLGERIQGFEFHPKTASLARWNVEEMLVEEGLTRGLAQLLARTWVAEEDFLAKHPGRATHVAANPPYLRWSKIPDRLSDVYRPIVRSVARNGDISVAFLDQMRKWLSSDGNIVALVNDRWMLALYGEKFLDDCERNGWGVEVLEECTARAFVRSVGVSAVIVRLSRGRNTISWSSNTRRQNAKALRDRLVGRHGTLSDAGCEVRVGPALGCGRTFLVNEDSTIDVEPELLRLYVDRVRERSSVSSKRGVKLIAPYDADGHLIKLCDYPLFEAWVEGHRARLAARSQVRQGMEWWRTIDAVGPIWNRVPKLLVPELTKQPQVIVDSRASIPAHSIYAIWPGTWPAKVLARVLNAGLLQLEADAEAPTIKEKWYRFYKRFIVRTPLPSWGELSDAARIELADESAREFSRCFKGLFGFAPLTASANPPWFPRIGSECSIRRPSEGLGDL